MSNFAVKVEALTKHYRIGKNHVSLRESIGSLFSNEKKDSKKDFWALKDVSFEIKPGEAVGIIGKNGAGKSTLLKILSRITEPTSGRVEIFGRVSSLLEVGTGFHPELTGKENIYLNGTILGMSRQEVKAKIDSIIDFSGIEQFIETPVKHYSSGMYVRLAFAVAAHLEPEILIVDEVLAVGDSEFQSKCIGKMNEVTGEGRTVLFVSHNMSVIRKLCKTGILLHSGELIKAGDIDSVVSSYSNAGVQQEIFRQDPEINGKPTIIFANVENFDEQQDSIVIRVKVYTQTSVKCSLDFRICDQSGMSIGFSSLGTFSENDLLNIEQGENEYAVKLSIKGLAIGWYVVSADLTIPDKEYLCRADNILKFEVLKKPKDGSRREFAQSWNYGSFRIDAELV